uniref:Uncharacterized protein n=1 Tax=Siphoviridae sp. cttqT1 TaxID=2827961 RepID=A0A8S5TP17_9CAUD|nr:MAG TPA: hypothetical protein [Siphoviridae sp. cttqT1]
MILKCIFILGFFLCLFFFILNSPFYPVSFSSFQLL